MTNLDVIAKPYAKAAFEFANEKNVLQEWSKLLQTFSNLVSTNAMVDIFSSPMISQLEIVDILKNQLDVNFFNFLAILAGNKKLAIIPEIANQFEAIKNVYDNSKVATVTLAYTVDEDLLASLKASLEKRFNCLINMHVSVDPEIVGGAVVKVGDTVIDNSVSGRLDKLKSILLS